MLHCTNCGAHPGVFFTVPPIHPSRRAFGALSAMVLAGAALRTPSATLAPQLTVAVGGRATSAFRHLPLTVALQLDFFRQEGLSVSVREFASDALALDAVRQGAAQVCAIGYEHVVSPPLGAPEVRSLVLQGRAAQLALGVSTRALPRLNTLADLRGRKVGVDALGSLSHAMALLVLARAGLGPQDVAYVAVGAGASAAAAVRAQWVQALCHGDPVMAQLESKGELRLLSEARTLGGSQAVFGGALPGGCLAAPERFLHQRAADAQALVYGLVHALKWLQTAGPGDLVKAVPAADWQGDRGGYLAAFARVRETISIDGMMPSDGPATALRTMASLHENAQGLEHVNLARTFTHDFARKAKQRFFV